MTTITVKNLPPDLHRQLKKRASLNHRSLNNEIIACLQNSLQSRNINVDDFLSHVQKLRKGISGRLTDRTLSSLKREGRP